MIDFNQYLVAILEPTIADFEKHPRSVRHAFLACVIVCHAVDYLAFSKKVRSGTLRQKFENKSASFRLVDDIANAFKHVRTGDHAKPRLIVSQIISRPPGAAGVMAVGISRVGDPVGGVTLFQDLDVDLLQEVRRAVAFLHSQG